MKKLFFFVTTALSFFSCTAVKFENPQPAEVAALKAFPEKMLGTFTSDEQDTLKISSGSFSYSNGKEVNLTADLSAASAVLKKLKNNYILNIRDNGSWDVFPVKLSRNKIIVYYADLDEKTQQLLENISLVKEIRTAEGKLDHYLVEPSDKEFERLLKKKLFSHKVEFRRIQ